MSTIPESHRHCPIGHVAALLGDRWSLLIVREALRGLSRYQELRDALAISDHTLSRRLAHLIDVGVLERDPVDRTQYRLTAAGQDLSRVLAVVGDWGMRWTDVETPLRVPPAPILDAARSLGITPQLG